MGRKIKHHSDPKGRRLKEPILMCGNYVFMKAANTETKREKVVKRLHRTDSVKVRDITITVDVQSDSEPVQLFPIECVGASYSFTFQVLTRSSCSSGCSSSS